MLMLFGSFHEHVTKIQKFSSRVSYLIHFIANCTLLAITFYLIKNIDHLIAKKIRNVNYIDIDLKTSN